MIKKILLIVEPFPPVNEIGTVRWVKIIHYLKEIDNYEIDVLTTKKKFGKFQEYTSTQKDESLMCYVADYNNIFEPSSGFFSFIYRKSRGVWKSISKKYKKEPSSMHKVERPVQNRTNKITGISRFADKKGNFIYAINILIAKEIFKYAKKNIDLSRYDYIITTYNPHWPTLVASMIKEIYPHIHWVADFRDPVADASESGKALERDKYFIPKYCKDADIITVVDDHSDFFLGKEEGKKVVLTNGYDPAEYNRPIKSDYFEITYTGMLYGGKRNLSILYRTIKKLFDSDKLDRKKIRLVYAGSESNVAEKFAYDCNVDDVFINYGMIKRENALAIQRKASILVNAGWSMNGLECGWSGKMYEYMLMKRPIIYILTGSGNKFVKENIDKIGGVYLEENSPEGEKYVSNYIVEKYREWAEKGLVRSTQDKEYVESFSHKNIAKKLDKELKRIAR